MHGGSVRDSYGNILDYIYGTDGYDGALVEHVRVPWMRDSVHWEREFPVGTRPGDEDEEEEEEERRLFCSVRRLCIDNSRSFFKRQVGDHVVVPRDIRSAMMQLRGGDHAQPPFIARADAIRAVKKFLSLHKWHTGQNPLVAFQEGHARWELRSTLLCSNVYLRNIESLTAFLETLTYSIERAKVEAGEMVGPLAAQSVSEPATQMTLSSFHLFTHVTLYSYNWVLDIRKNGYRIFVINGIIRNYNWVLYNYMK